MILESYIKPGNRDVVLIHELEFKPVFMRFSATVNNFTFGLNGGDGRIVTDNFYPHDIIPALKMVKQSPSYPGPRLT